MIWDWLLGLSAAAVVGGAVYFGARRGLILVALEAAGFVFATVLSLAGYAALGHFLSGWAGSTALANLSAFAGLWLVVEIIYVLVARYVVLPRLPRPLPMTPVLRAAGGALNGAKALLLIILSLIVWAGLPLEAGLKQPITDTFVARELLASSGQLQSWVAQGLGRDLNAGLSALTAPPDPESTQRLDLGFTTTAGHVDTAAEAAMLDLVNHERTSRGLPALTANPAAQTVARDYSRTMLEAGYFGHLDNDGHTPFDRLKSAGVPYGAAGENLALAATLQLAHQGLMNSPGHRANILSPRYHTVGIGIINAGPYGLMVTQDFTD